MNINKKISCYFSYGKVDIQRNGRLAVNGGNAHQTGSSYIFGGGAGGIIQIISPEGSLAAKTSVLGPGNVIGCFKNVENGYMHLPGNV